MSDPYAVLGISPGCPQEEIKKAYRKKSLELHPDRNQNNAKATAAFQELGQAYSKIDTPEKRQQFDAMSRMRQGPGGRGMDIESMLRAFMAAGGPGQGNFTVHTNNGSHGAPHPGMPQFFFSQTQMQKAAPIIKHIEVSMEQAYTGCMMPVSITRWTLNGDVKEKEEETLYVEIPEGVDSNEIVVCKGKGNTIAADNVGDVKIFVKVKSHDKFVRHGIDLVYQQHVSLRDALCGFTLEMEHLNGKSFKINNAEGAVLASGSKRIVNGLGMKRGTHQGRLIIEFIVDFPQKLDVDVVSKLREILPK